MGRPKKREGADTRDRLLRAAEAEFGSVGFHRARLEDIAAAAGIRRSSLLYYFGSKEKLFDEVVLVVTAALRACLVEAVATPGDPTERVVAIGEALLRFSQERAAAVAMFVRELLDSPPGSEKNMAEFVSIIDWLEERVRSEVGHLIPEGAPVRAALLHIMTSQALRVAAGDVGRTIWGDDVDPRVFLRALLNQR